jgi:hypothetical protein
VVTGSDFTPTFERTMPRRLVHKSGPEAVDLAHPYFFERELDHVPGVHLIETFRQAALACACAAHGLTPAGHVVLSLNGGFTEFAELELPLDCDVRVGEATVEDGLAVVPVRLAMVQEGERVASASLRLRCPAG